MKKEWLKHYILAFVFLSIVIVFLLFFASKMKLTGQVVATIDISEDANYKDGYIDSINLKDTTQTYLSIGGGDDFSIFIDFNTASIPDAATINSVKLKLYYYSGTGNNVNIFSLSAKSTSLSDANLRSETTGGGSSIGLRSNYGIGGAPPGYITIDLGITANSELKDNLGSDFFSIGINCFSCSFPGFPRFYSFDFGSNWPQLEVDYTLPASDNPPNVTLILPLNNTLSNNQTQNFSESPC